MPENNQLIRVHVNIELPAVALQSVVANSKKKVGKDEKGRFRVDTADMLAELISKFLQEKDFKRFADDINNY